MGNLLNGVQTATLTKNTWALCATRHTVRAETTGAEAGKDNISISYKLESTSGIGKGYHTKDGYLHKIRITIFKDGEIAYQQDVAGDDSGNFITLPPFLITGEGKWEITAKTIAAGDCAKPEGEKNFAYLYAKAPEPVEEEQEEDRAKTAQDLTPLLTVGMVGLAGLVFGKVLRGKKKAAENLQNEWPVCKCGNYLTGNPKDVEQKCLSCGKLSHRYCGDKRKRYANCAFCKSTNVEVTNLEEHQKWNEFNRRALEKIRERKWIKNYCSKDELNQKTDNELALIVVDMHLKPMQYGEESRQECIERILEKCNSLKEKHPNLKEAETFEAKKTPKYQQAMDFIHHIFYEPNSEEYKVFQQVKRVMQTPHSLWYIWATYCYFNLRQTEQYQDLLEGGENRLRANLGKCGRFTEEKELYSKYGVMNLQQFINAIAAAERKTQTRAWIGYGEIIVYNHSLYYLTRYDTTTKPPKLWSQSSIFPDYSVVTKEAFKRLNKNQRKTLLKAKAGRKEAETFF